MVRPVKTIRMSAADIDEIRSFPGLVKPTREIDLAFRVGGPLIEFDVRIGQRIARGEIIARIDPRDFEIDMARISALLAESRWFTTSTICR